ncbi:Eco29kI family restriction endonuclease [Streptomyces sp. ISL-44]|uniref:Eco29kI family restriction endonuclease n=1 Tax=Streptomyces sp. ISL-44 TaxID=2819184 RepID=UPI001BE95736|nr:Eco29kI family restriction endonuclease [Streptomyces sp. ISL-44]MBT2543550.1 Eco29kI family restriction endonuclease [Streptomyces sp. ISL-44]
MSDRDDIYDPLRRENLGRSVQWALEETNPIPLGSVRSQAFNGCGIYAIYYVGNHDLYKPLADHPFEVPIYVGRSTPEGSRTGSDVKSPEESKSLRSRLMTHENKIKKVDDLEIDDFYTRFLPADDLFTPMAESMMITELQPVWNVILHGFGVNTPGDGRKNQTRSKWHEVHRGVPAGDALPPHPGGPNPLREKVILHLATHAVRPAHPAGVPPTADSLVWDGTVSSE